MSDPLKFGSPAIEVKFGPNLAAATRKVVTEAKLSSPSPFCNPAATGQATPNLSSAQKSEAAILPSSSKGPLALASDAFDLAGTPIGSSSGFGGSPTPAAFGIGTPFGGKAFPFANNDDGGHGRPKPPSTKRFKQG